MGPEHQHASSMLLFLLPAWVFCTSMASLSGTQFVKLSLDCLTPATLVQAAGALVFVLHRWQHNQGRQGLYGPGVVALGTLQVLSSALTLGSFGLVGVSGTYMVRAVEPLCSCVLLTILHKRNISSPRELLLVAVVVASIWCVVCPHGVHMSAQLTDKTGLTGNMRGSFAPFILAFVATATLSCRSITAKTLAAATGRSELELFLASFVPGLLLMLVLQTSVWVLHSIPAMPRLRGPAETNAAVVMLLVCTVFHCAYNIISFKVLQLCSPVLHAVLNVMKRLVVLMVCVFMTGTPLTHLQLLGVVTANIAVGLLSVQTTGTRRTFAADLMPDKAKLPKSSADMSAGKLVQGLSADPAEVPGAPASKRHSTSAGHASRSSDEVLMQLAHVLPIIIAAGAVALVYVLVALQQAGVSGSASGSPVPIIQMPASLQLHDTGFQMTWDDSQFAWRDLQRVKCLRTLHSVSKAALDPFLNHTTGGVALYDVAVHVNLGDAVLWAAAARLVSEFHHSAKVVCAVGQYGNAETRRLFPTCDVARTARAIGKGGVVLLAPGGNWGDLWWPVQKKRVQYLQAMSKIVKNGTADFKVVQLPQTIEFSNKQQEAQTDKTVNSMPPGMFTLFARADASTKYAKQHYPNATVLQAPDAAWSLGPLMPNPAQVDILFVMRKDKEAADSEQGFTAEHANVSAVATNSSDSSGGGDDSMQSAMLQRLVDRGISYVVRDWDYNQTHGFNFSRETSKVALTQFAESRLQGAIDVVSLGKVVVTNRLHVAITANLLGRPLVWIDTKQQKLSGVRAFAFSYDPLACTEANMHSKQVASFEEAVTTAAEWVSSPGFVWSIDQVVSSVTGQNAEQEDVSGRA